MIVTLSRRNLLSLLAKLEEPGSHRTIIKPDGVMVIAESDELHYGNRFFPPGPMSPSTERLAAYLDSCLETWRQHEQDNSTPA
jgi:hypothetical protein